MLPDRLLDAFGDKSRITTTRGQFLGFDGGAALVGIDSGRLSCLTLGYTPTGDEWVHVWIIDGAAFLAGPVLPVPDIGTVTAASGSTATVDTIRGTLLLPVVAGLTVNTNDVVAIGWGSTPKITSIVVDAPDPATPPPPPPANQTVQTQNFLAIDTGTMNRSGGSYWNGEVWASDTTFGAWFYGRKIKDTIHANAVIESIQIRTPWKQIYGFDPRFMLHQLAEKNGTPVPVDTRAYPARDDWVTLPTSWGDALKAGGSQWGVGLNQGGFNKAKSRAQDEWSGALKITWRV